MVPSEANPEKRSHVQPSRPRIRTLPGELSIASILSRPRRQGQFFTVTFDSKTTGSPLLASVTNTKGEVIAWVTTQFGPGCVSSQVTVILPPADSILVIATEYPPVARVPRNTATTMRVVKSTWGGATSGAPTPGGIGGLCFAQSVEYSE